MKNRHKYFRNEAYKQKLAKKSRHRYVLFITKEPASNYPESLGYLKYIKSEDHWDAGRSAYTYYDPPVKLDVPFGLIERQRKMRFKTALKKRRNRQLRRNYSDWISSHRGDYRKLYEYWWEVD